VDNSSYFFAELTRLQFVIENLKEGNYLVILDEILKGTNSIDKAEGSKKLIQKLVKMNVPGIIATHDLSLCEISKNLHEVKNYFFETEIRDDELFFDYQLKEGICKNMNASFLLKRMDIT
jgi:DNA mismatch repair ATPase MutS